MTGKSRCLAEVSELLTVLCKHICYQFGYIYINIYAISLKPFGFGAVQLLMLRIHAQVTILQYKKLQRLLAGSPSILCWPSLFSKES